jgi:hypothetical protein
MFSPCTVFAIIVENEVKCKIQLIFMKSRNRVLYSMK